MDLSSGFCGMLFWLEYSSNYGGAAKFYITHIDEPSCRTSITHESASLSVHFQPWIGASTHMGSEGPHLGQWSNPLDQCWDSQSQVIVCDHNNDRVLRIRVSDIFEMNRILSDISTDYP